MEGAFDGQMSSQQTKVKDKIEALIAQTRSSGDPGTISCSVLATFEHILSPQPQASVDRGEEGPGRETEADSEKEREADPEIERTDPEKERKPDDSEPSGDETDVSDDETDIMGYYASQEELEPDEEKRTANAADIESNERTVSDMTPPQHNNTARDEDAKHRLRSHDLLPEPVCWRVRPMACRWPDYLFQPLIHPVTNISTVPCFNQCRQCWNRKRLKRRARTWKECCHYYQLFALQGNANMNKNTTEASPTPTAAHFIRESCRLPHKCSWQCYYGMHKQQCLQHYHMDFSATEKPAFGNEDDHSDDLEADDEELRKTAWETDDSESQETDTENHDKDREGEAEEEPSILTFSEPDDSDRDNGDEETTREVGSEVTDDTEAIDANTADNDPDRININTQSPDDKTIADIAQDHSERLSQREHTPDSSNSRSSKAENKKEEGSRHKTHNAKNSEQDKRSSPLWEDSEWQRLEAALNHKSLEQTAKIQALEVLVMKLENQVLSQKLAQEHNGTRYLVQLENHVLRLENQLLKLNHSYHALRADNDALRSRHSKYLALEHAVGQQGGQGQGMSLPSNASEYFRLIHVQQEKLGTLSELLSNQTSLLTKLRARGDQLEEQNHALHGIVLNQTALISHLMQNLNQLSQQTLRDQRETSDQLRSFMEQQSTSSATMGKLQGVADDGGKSASQVRLPPASVCSLVGQRQGQGQGLSPFRNFSWISCLEALSQSRHARRDKERQKGKEQKDEKLIEEKEDKEGPPDSVDIPKAETISDGPTADNSEDKDKEDNADKHTDTPPLSDMQPLPVVVEDDKEPVKEENEAKKTSDSDRTGGAHSIHQGKGAGQRLEEKPDNTEDEHEDNQDTLDKLLELKSSSKEDPGKGGKDTTDNSQKKEVADKKQFGPVSPPSVEDIKPEASEKERTVDAQQETRRATPAMKEEEPQRKEPSAEDLKRKQEVEKALKLKQEAEAMQKKIKEADSRRPPYWSNDNKKPKDCYDLYVKSSRDGSGLRNGAYKVFIKGLELYVSVYCDMKGGGWTLLMMREDGSLDFFRDWEDYKEGFGTPFGEQYLGNEVIHYLTCQDQYSLQVDLKDWKASTRTARYTHFWIDGEEHKYQLHVLGYVHNNNNASSGNSQPMAAGDGFYKHDGMRFSTRDNDNDLLSKDQMGGSCAHRFKGAGWYHKCYTSNVLGVHYEGGAVPDKRYDGMAWKPWTGPSYSLKYVVLKVRPRLAGFR